MSNKLGIFIKEYRLNKNYSLRKFAEKCGISHTHIDSIERGADPRTGKPVNITSDVIERFAIAMNVEPAFLFNLSIDIEGQQKRKGVLIPILGKVVAGIPLEAIEEISGYEEITPELAKTGDFFALEIKGISMEPRILEGDIVIVKKQTYIESGEIAVVLVNGDEATIKQVIKQKDGILLHAYNPAAYAPKFYSNEQIQSLPVEIVGKVVELRGKF